MKILPKLLLATLGLGLVMAIAGTTDWNRLLLHAQEAADSPGKPTDANAKPAPADPAPIVASQEATELLQNARKKLRTQMYEAKIVQKMNFPGRSLEATGRILCGQKFRMRLEFQITAGATKGSLLQVCDGDKLWTQRTVNDVIRLTEQDVKQILREARLDSMQQNLVIAEMGLGGITSLLASLDRTMVFGKPQEERIDGETFSLVQGEWNEEILGLFKGNPHLKKGLPLHIPDGARVYLDADDFPRRIQYLKRDRDKQLQPMITLDFLDLKWISDADVPANAFEYQAPDRVIPTPVTDKYIEQLQRPAPPAR